MHVETLHETNDQAVAMFQDNVRYNSMLSKMRAKLRKRHQIKLKPDTVLLPVGVTASIVLEKLALDGIILTERTLRNYAKKGIISPPKTVNLGRGTGKIAVYDPDILSQIKKMKLRRDIS